MYVYAKTIRITGKKFGEHVGKNGYKLPMDLSDALDYELYQWYNNGSIHILSVSVQSIFDTFEFGAGTMEFPVIHWVTIIYK